MGLVSQKAEGLKNTTASAIGIQNPRLMNISMNYSVLVKTKLYGVGIILIFHQQDVFLIWDKQQPEDVSFASCEFAWTSLSGSAKTFYLSPLHTKEYRIHTTQKPVALYAWIFSRYAKPGYKILDTHLGSASSRIAAWDAGLDFVGCEIDPDYFKAQEERFQAHSAQLRFA